ncbi:hypothetical protein B0H19DRAFT_1268892 [Mycena capillaripes]|nr:hypothetical protein B0H19DRAFT_1268892 [Mycena capillaripes]
MTEHIEPEFMTVMVQEPAFLQLFSSSWVRAALSFLDSDDATFGPLSLWVLLRELAWDVLPASPRWLVAAALTSDTRYLVARFIVVCALRWPRARRAVKDAGEVRYGILHKQGRAVELRVGAILDARSLRAAWQARWLVALHPTLCAYRCSIRVPARVSGEESCGVAGGAFARALRLRVLSGVCVC